MALAPLHHGLFEIYNTGPVWRSAVHLLKAVHCLQKRADQAEEFGP
jgi:hypothetical protein